MTENPETTEPTAPIRGSRRWRWLAIVVTAIVAGVGGSVGTAWAIGGFSDVPSSNPFYDEINWMAGTGISEGYGDGTFRPAQNVSRQAMSAFMLRLYNLNAGLSDLDQVEDGDDPTTDEAWSYTGAEAQLVIPAGTTGRISAIGTASVTCNSGDNIFALIVAVRPTCNFRIVISKPGDDVISPTWTVEQSRDASTEPDPDLAIDMTTGTFQVATESLPAGTYSLYVQSMKDDSDSNTGAGSDPLSMSVGAVVLRADVLLDDYVTD